MRPSSSGESRRSAESGAGGRSRLFPGSRLPTVAGRTFRKLSREWIPYGLRTISPRRHLRISFLRFAANPQSPVVCNNRMTSQGMEAIIPKTKRTSVTSVVSAPFRIYSNAPIAIKVPPMEQLQRQTLTHLGSHLSFPSISILLSKRNPLRVFCHPWLNLRCCFRLSKTWLLGIGVAIG